MDSYHINFNFQKSQALLEFKGALTKGEILRCISKFVEGVVDDPVITISMDFQDTKINTDFLTVYEIVDIFDFNVFLKEIEIILIPSSEKRLEEQNFFNFFEKVFLNSGYNLKRQELVG